MDCVVLSTICDLQSNKLKVSVGNNSVKKQNVVPRDLKHDYKPIDKSQTSDIKMNGWYWKKGKQKSYLHTRTQSHSEMNEKSKLGSSECELYRRFRFCALIASTNFGLWIKIKRNAHKSWVQKKTLQKTHQTYLIHLLCIGCHVFIGGVSWCERAVLALSLRLCC